jgi:hypothetical protein
MKPRPTRAWLRSYSFWARAASAGNLDLGRELRNVLRLDRAVYGRQNLALANPGASVDQHRAHHATFAGNADRLIATRCQCARCGYDPRDLGITRNNHGDGRNLPLFGGPASAAALSWPPENMK